MHNVCRTRPYFSQNRSIRIRKTINRINGGKMIKVITAMNNPKINIELNKIEEIKILAKDIIYQEGIFEILEKYKEIDYIIISEKIYGHLKIEELINKIKQKNNKIKVILFLENSEEKINNKKIYKIINKKIEINNLVKILKNENIEEVKQKENQKVITIIGTRGIGKSIFSIILATILSKNEKILLNDFSNTIYLINNKINKNLDIKKEKNNYSENYKYIIIDTNFLNKEIIEKTNLFLFLLGGNLLEIKKAEKLLKIYSEKNKIKNVKLIINKYTDNCIDYEIIKNIFNNYKIIGKINYNEKYDLLINKKIKKINKEIKRDYIQLIKKMKGENYGINNKSRTTNIKR